MLNNLDTNPYSDTAVDDIEKQDGIIDNLPVLELGLDDKVILGHINRLIDDSRDYWNSPKGFDLKNVRNKNVSMYEGRYEDQDKLYTYQIPYIDNELFVAIESIVAYVTAQLPNPVTYPAQKTIASKILAEDLQKYIKAWLDAENFTEKLETAVRNALRKRIGLLYLYFDPLAGEHGELKIAAPDPEHIIIDKNAAMGEEPGFICHVQKCKVEELLARYSDKKDDIFAAIGIKRGTPRQMGATIAYREVWFTYYEDNEPKEAVTTYFRDVVLEKTRTPNWVYEGESDTLKNFLDYPKKMFFPINIFNNGTHWIDNTTGMEQAASLQEHLNKRGQQITENADTANAMDLYDAKVITAETAQNMTNDTNQRVLLNVPQGKNISEVYTTKEPHMLPEYVIEDKVDLRQTIHNIMGTPSQFTGTNAESDKLQTLGQSLMLKNQATGRQDMIVRAVDRCVNKLLPGVVQMMKVWYTDTHFQTIDGEDGDFDRIELNNNKIEDGVAIRVEGESTVPMDKQQLANTGMQLAKLDRISTYDLYKMLDLKDAQKMYDNYFKEKSNPELLKADVDLSGDERMAYIDFIDLMNGKKVDQRDDTDQGYILSFRKQMISDKFLHAKPKQQKAVRDFLQIAVDALSARTALDTITAPEEEQEDQQQPQQPPQSPPMPPGAAPMPPAGLPGNGLALPPPPVAMPPQVPPGALPPQPLSVAQIMQAR